MPGILRSGPFEALNGGRAIISRFEEQLPWD
jgi:hypothetical protein